VSTGDIPDKQQQYQEGQSLLARISTEMVRAQKQFFGKGPTQAKSYFLDDMLIIVMKGGMTTAEKTMLEFDESDKVRDFRQVFENRMTEQLSGMIEEITGRKVLTYQSQILFDPDRIFEIFVFDDNVKPELIRATAEGQLRGEPFGEVGSEDLGLDDASSSGQST
jgi:uncharacterized protein YbcI